MTLPIFNSTDSLLAVVFIMIAFSMWLQKYSALKSIGPVLTVIVIGIILSNLKIVPGSHELYGTLGTYCIPISVSLYLLNVDFQGLKKLSRQPWIAIICAVFSVSIISVIFGVVFGNVIPEGWKVAGMFVGTYTGGSANLTAIAVGLNAAQETIASANAADYVIGIPVLILLFAMPAILRKMKWIERVWPYHYTEAERQESDGSGSLMGSDTWSIRDIAYLLALAITISTVAGIISAKLFPESFMSAGKILLNTTISLIMAQLPMVKKLKGNMSLGLLFGMMYLSTIGFMVDIRAFFGSTLAITLFCACVIFGAMALHLLILRLFKVKYEYAVLSITGAIADGPTAALVASGGGWNSLVGIGLIMGVIGGVCGNYVGIGVAYLIKMLIGA